MIEKLASPVSAETFSDAPMPEYFVHGDGPNTLFMLHGAYGDSRYYESIIGKYLAMGLRVVAWNCPGYGNTEVPDGYGINLLARSCARMVLTEATGFNILLGHSMGGLIGPNAANLLGDRLQLLILCGSSAGFPNRTEADKERYLAERVAPIQNGMTVRDYAPGLLKTMMAPHAAGPNVEKVYEVVSSMKTEAFLASMKAIVEYNSVPQLQRVAQPTLLVAGERDTACPPAGMKRMAAMVPDSEFHEISGVGHYPFAENEQEFFEVTTAFILRRLNL